MVLRLQLTLFLFLQVLLGFAQVQAQQDTNAKEKSAKQFAQQALSRNDKNGDGKVTKDEAVGLLLKNFDAVDKNSDGFVDADELKAVGARMNGGRSQKNRPKRQVQVPENVILKTDIAYRDGNKKWKLDLARPRTPAKQPQPAIVFIHGGGWQSGDKGGGLWRSLPIEYATKGYVCISINYRLLNDGTILDCIADCKCAVRWLRANAKQYNVDPDRIGAFGISAGAHLVSVMGLATREAKLEGDGPFADQSSMVQAVCCAAPPTDFINWKRDKKPDPTKKALSRMFGKLDLDKARRQASPVTYASKSAPPFLIIHGTKDTTVPVSQGDALYESLKKADAEDLTYMKLKGFGHGVFNQSKKTKPAMEKFFDRVLMKKSSAQ